jgi:hypothetical protein
MLGSTPETLCVCYPLYCRQWTISNVTIRHDILSWVSKGCGSVYLFICLYIIKEVTRRRGRRRKKLLDDLKDRRGYSRLKEEALDRTMWRNRFGRGFGPVVRQNTDWMNIIKRRCFKLRCVMPNDFALGRITLERFGRRSRCLLTLQSFDWLADFHLELLVPDGFIIVLWLMLWDHNMVASTYLPHQSAAADTMAPILACLQLYRLTSFPPVVSLAKTAFHLQLPLRPMSCLPLGSPSYRSVFRPPLGVLFPRYPLPGYS